MKLITNSHGIPGDRMPGIIADAIASAPKWKKGVWAPSTREYTIPRVQPEVADFMVNDPDIGRVVETRVRRDGGLLRIDRAEYAVPALAVALAAGLIQANELQSMQQSVSQETGDTGFMSN